MPRAQRTVIVPCAYHQGILLAWQQILLVGNSRATRNVTSMHNKRQKMTLATKTKALYNPLHPQGKPSKPSDVLTPDMHTEPVLQSAYLPEEDEDSRQEDAALPDGTP